MIAAGQGAEVLDALEAIGSTSTDLGIELGILWAESLQAVGRADEAVDSFAAARPAARSDSIGRGVASRLAALPPRRHRCGARRARTGTARRRRARPTMPVASPGLAAISWSRGERDEALGEAQRALDLATRAGDDKALATAYTMLTMVARVDGDHIAHHRNYIRALEHAERAKDLLQLVRMRCNNGSHLTEDGEYAKALAELDVATRLADLGGYGMFRGLCLTNRAEALIAIGRLDEAVSDLESARIDLPSRSPRRWTPTHSPCSARSTWPAATGRWRSPPSRRRWPSPPRPSRSRPSCRRSPDSPWPASMTIRVAALDAATRAVGHEATVHHAKALIALGWVRLETGDAPTAIELADRAGRLARERGDRAALALALELAAAGEDEDDAPSARCSPTPGRCGRSSAPRSEAPASTSPSPRSRPAPMAPPSPRRPPTRSTGWAPSETPCGPGRSPHRRTATRPRA